MSYLRRCTRQLCAKSAVATLTYIYADSTAVLGPLAAIAEPHTYDLCKLHSEKLTTPRGWELVRLQLEGESQVPNHDDLLALANAVREAARVPVSDPDAVTQKPFLRLVPPEKIEEETRF